MASTQLVFFDEFHVKQVSGTPTTSQVNDYNVLFPRYEEGKVDVERGAYDTNNQPKKSNFKYDQEGQFCLGVAKVESKEYRKIIGKRCPVFDDIGKKVVTIKSYKNKFEMNSQE